ncbi:MAG TPA: hypothetical protein DCX22_01495 [Dehalococcoidia bacterium]|nr:hypothetical protein [Dehalococcoidia bacterium]
MDAVIATVISQKGTCSAGHKAGDVFDIGELTPDGMCAWAYYTLYPFSTVLRFGGSFPWEPDTDKSIVACPDPDNPVIFELRRIRKS